MTSIPHVELIGARASARWGVYAGMAGLLLGAFFVALLSSACLSRAEAGLAQGSLNKLGWSVRYMPTSGSVTDGTVFYNAKFKGKSVFKDFRIPFSYVDYTPRLEPFHDIVDQLGALNFDNKTPTFRGCKGSNVTRPDGVKGYLVNCDYRFDVPGWRWVETPPDEPNPRCALYRYEERMYFYADGSFKPEIVAWGPGYENPHNYLVAFRLNVAAGSNGDPGDIGFAQLRNGTWQRVLRERAYNGVNVDDGGNAWMVSTKSASEGPRILIKPGVDDGSTLWFFKRGKPEDSFDGQAKTTTPAEFLKPAESLAGANDLYLWYRATVHNPGCYTIPHLVGPDLILTEGY
jgi:hypothetical protein